MFSQLFKMPTAQSKTIFLFAQNCFLFTPTEQSYCFNIKYTIKNQQNCVDNFYKIGSFHFQLKFISSNKASIIQNGQSIQQPKMKNKFSLFKQIGLIPQIVIRMCLNVVFKIQWQKGRCL